MDVKRFDGWIEDQSKAAAITLRALLEPVEGREQPVFPPTYSPEEGDKTRKAVYCIDELPDGRNVCVIDSVGSQANRIEPMFKEAQYAALVPQMTIRLKDGLDVNLLDVGHRAADAAVRFTPDLAEPLNKAFVAWSKQHNAEPLARLAPTSLIFGVWDSRETYAKVPRLLTSSIRAFEVTQAYRKAQYWPAVDYVREEVLADDVASADDGTKAVPCAQSLGGVYVKGPIVLSSSLSLVALRTLDADQAEKGMALRRYILGLSLVAFTAPRAHFLRQGCMLVQDANSPTTMSLIGFDGKPESLKLTHAEALAYAKVCAEAFGVAKGSRHDFKPNAAKKQAERTTERRTGGRARARQEV